jgi:hypothetical protein
MKTLTTVIITFGLFIQSTYSQFTENFNQDITGLPSKCWQTNQFTYTTTSGEVINGTGSAYSNPSTSSSSPSSIATPFLKMNSTSLTISFKYKLSNPLVGQASRTMQIGIVDKNGVFTLLQTIISDKNTPTTVITQTATYTISTGVYRVEIRVYGDNGDGNTRVIFDDLSVSASAYYTGFCNPAAVAVNDSYIQNTMSSLSGNVLSNDNIPSDNDTYTALLVSSPTQGTLTFNANGTFTYTPAASFTGGTITFSYQVVDNGYSPTTSNIATVTLNYSISAILPIKLLSFTSTEEGSWVKLLWKAETTQYGEYFELEASADGKQFASFKKIKAISGVNEYSALDPKVSVDAYYRLKMVNNDGSVTYSKVVVINKQNGSADLRLLNNPVTSTLNATYEAGTASSSTIKVYSFSGVKMYEQKVNSVKGFNKISIVVQSLPTGTYVLVLDAHTSIKFIKG